MKRTTTKVLIHMNHKIVVSRIRINDTDGDSDPYISDLTEILENASSYPESLKKITTLILSNTAIKI